MEKLYYQSAPIVTLATNKFINVPVILKYNDTPLIEIVHFQSLGFTTQIPIYHPDGTYLAKVNGTRLYLTKAGQKAGLEIRQPQNMTVCKMGDRTLFEIHHESGNAFKTYAELFTPDGCFVKCTDSPTPELMGISGELLQIGGIRMSHCTFQNMSIGIWLKSDGSCALGCS